MANYSFFNVGVVGLPQTNVEFNSNNKYSYFEPTQAYSGEQLAFLEQLKNYGQLPYFDVENLFLYAPLSDQTHGKAFYQTESSATVKYVWEADYFQRLGYIDQFPKNQNFLKASQILSGSLGYPIATVSAEGFIYGAYDSLNITTNRPSWLVSGNTYSIESFVTGDNFQNSGAASNIAGTTFTYNGTEPTWVNGSVLTDITDNQTIKIFRFDPVSNTVVELLDFPGDASLGMNVSNDENKRCPLFYINGKIYGSTRTGGDNGVGTFFEFNILLNEIKILHHFITGNGASGVAGLFYYLDALYGITNDTSAGDSIPTIFEFNLITETYTVKKTFDNSGTEGGSVVPGLVFYGGKLYGACRTGGTYLVGTLFSWEAGLNSLTVLHHFEDTSPHANTPIGGLTLVNSTLYGTANLGGADEWGAIFKWDITNNLYEVVYSFDGVVGGYPISTMLFYNQRLYGISESINYSVSPGEIFEFNPENGHVNLRTRSAYYQLLRQNSSLIEFGENLYLGCSESSIGNFIAKFDPRYTVQLGEIPSLFSKNALDPSELKISTERLTVPTFIPVFVAIREVAGANLVYWKLTDVTVPSQPKELAEIEAGWSFIWRFPDAGEFEISARVIDLWGNEHTLPAIKFIKVMLKADYLLYIENQFAARKIYPRLEPNSISMDKKTLSVNPDAYEILEDGTISAKG